MYLFHSHWRTHMVKCTSIMSTKMGHDASFVINIIVTSLWQSLFYSIPFFFQKNQRNARKIAKRAYWRFSALSAITDSDWKKGFAKVREFVGIWLDRSFKNIPFFSCDQAALRTAISVCPSVTPFWQCFCHRIIMKFSGVITNDRSDVHAKDQCQRSKVKVTEVMTPFSRVWTVTPVWIHIWWWNDA